MYVTQIQLIIQIKIIVYQHKFYWIGNYHGLTEAINLDKLNYNNIYSL